MISTVILVAMMVGVGWFLWGRRQRRQLQMASPSPQGVSPETLAIEAFAHGNTCLAEGRFDEATTSFYRARELDPKRPHVADRLAEVERRQRAVISSPAAASS
jgi:hypothetical protein